MKVIQEQEFWTNVPIKWIFGQKNESTYPGTINNDLDPGMQHGDGYFRVAFTRNDCSEVGID